MGELDGSTMVPRRGTSDDLAAVGPGRSGRGLRRRGDMKEVGEKEQEGEGREGARQRGRTTAIRVK